MFYSGPKKKSMQWNLAVNVKQLFPNLTVLEGKQLIITKNSLVL